MITVPDQRYENYQKNTDFIRKYIFPGGHLPSLKSLLKVTHKHTRFNLLSLEDFTEHYAKTLQIWQKNFNGQLDKVKNLNFDDYFIRVWNMYLSYCQAGFLTRHTNLLQVVFTRDQNTNVKSRIIMSLKRCFTLFKKLIISNLFFIFIGCHMRIEDFNQTQPELIPQKFFSGELVMYGLVKDWKGSVIRSFKGQIQASWNEEGIGTLAESFVFNDGEQQNRSWTLKPIDEKTFIATASDVVGKGQFTARGNSMFGRYTLQIPYRNSTIDLNIQDWLHLQEDGIILNHAKMKKFGITVGELIVTMIKK